MKIVGYCLCECPVYENEDGEPVFTCEEFPCELQEPRDIASDYWPLTYDGDDYRIGGER